MVDHYDSVYENEGSQGLLSKILKRFTREKQVEMMMGIAREDVQRGELVDVVLTDESSYHELSLSSMCFAASSYLGHRTEQDDLVAAARVGATTHSFGFTEEIHDKAWKLVQEYMSANQWKHFIGGKSVELVNRSETHRILLSSEYFKKKIRLQEGQVDNQSAGRVKFVILEGELGEGLVVSEGAITQRKYPIGDEVATFLAWFEDRTLELIERWNCGTYAIVDEGVTKW